MTWLSEIDRGGCLDTGVVLEMNHPERLALLPLFLASFGLSVLGQTMADKVYRKHFSTSFEANAYLRTAVNQRNWLNPRLILGLVLLLIITLLADQMPQVGEPDLIMDLLFTAMFTYFAVIIGRHLSSLLIFNHVNRNPSELSGVIQMTTRLQMHFALFQHVAVIPVVVLLTIYSPNRYTVGALLGVSLLMGANLFWAFQARSATPGLPPVVEAELAEAEAVQQ